jgi:ribosomal protein S8
MEENRYLSFVMSLEKLKSIIVRLIRKKKFLESIEYRQRGDNNVQQQLNVALKIQKKSTFTTPDDT